MRDGADAPGEIAAMLLAEALAARKDALEKIKELEDLLGSAMVRDEDERAYDVAGLMTRFEARLTEYGELTTRINRTNNVATIRFEGRAYTLMEAVALRERLLLEARTRRGAHQEAIDTIGRTGYGLRSKDQVKRVATVDLNRFREATDAISERTRRLDIVMQQANWTTDLVE